NRTRQDRRPTEGTLCAPAGPLPAGNFPPAGTAGGPRESLRLCAGRRGRGLLNETGIRKGQATACPFLCALILFGQLAAAVGFQQLFELGDLAAQRLTGVGRSEEHTSELQSR